MNQLLKGQHQILIKEMAKMEQLNHAIIEAREKREMQHSQKMDNYQKTKLLLQEEIKKKDEIISKLGVFRLPSSESEEVVRSNEVV